MKLMFFSNFSFYFYRNALICFALIKRDMVPTKQLSRMAQDKDTEQKKDPKRLENS